MKKSDLKALINECIHEVLAEESADKKTKAINEIKRIIAENELTEEELLEVEFFKKLAKRTSDAARQLTGIPRTKDKKDFEDQIEKLKQAGEIDDRQAKILDDTAKTFAYIGRIVGKNKKYAFDGESGVPATGGSTSYGTALEGRRK